MSTEVITVSGINAFYGSSQALFGLSLVLHQGETLALLGRNGAGKSTTMKAIAGVLPVRGGSVALRNQDITNLPPHEISRRGIAYVPEDRQIFPHLSVEDNLLIGEKKGVSGNHAWTLSGVYDALPLLKRLKSRMGGQLSGGEQQMLTIGRALMGNPDVLLLDEPSEGLAPIIVQQIGELITELQSRGATIILAEQNLQFCIELADNAVVIDRGCDVFSGTMAELNDNAELKQRYLSV
ncbi:MAG TPA: ABC transporter ATP-binding protein [Burkholderiaceae bacterium]|nr:ABC transporter ATP-binding protein [Burkholderiaceae bacterium]